MYYIGSFFVLTNHHCQRSPLGSVLSLHLFFKFPSQRTIVVFYSSFSLAFYITFMFGQLLTSVLYALGRADLIALYSLTDIIAISNRCDLYFKLSKKKINVVIDDAMQ